MREHRLFFLALELTKPAKAHRYLAGYMSAGLVSQDAATGRYDLGPFALHMGLAALRRLDITTLCAPVMDRLRDEVTETVSLAIWTARGPTLLRWVCSDAPVTINVSPGTALPVTTSSNGRIFAAYLRPAITHALIEAELDHARRAGLGAGPRTREELDTVLVQVRADGLSVVDGAVLPGICSLTAPVFSHDCNLAASLTVLGVTGVIDSSMGGAPARALRLAARDLSERLGWRNTART